MGPRITGRVVDERGRPVEGAAVGLYSLRAMQRLVDVNEFLDRPPQRSDARGRFSISTGRAGSEARLVIAAPRRQCCSIELSKRLLSQGGNVGETTLVPGSRLLGRVQDAEGKGIAGARVGVWSNLDEHLVSRIRAVSGATSDAQGKFHVPCTPRRGLKVVVSARGFAPQSRFVIAKAPTFVLERTGIVRGKVVDGRGRPIAGVHLGTVTVASRVWPQFSVSDSTGAFEINVPNAPRFRIAGFESKPPYRDFSSGLLHGAHSNLRIRPTNGLVANPRKIELRALPLGHSKGATARPEQSATRSDRSDWQRLSFELQGELPRNGRYLLSFRGVAQHGHRSALQMNPLARIEERVLHGEERKVIALVAPGSAIDIFVRRASRFRVGWVTSKLIGRVRARQPDQEIVLPDLRCVVMRGSVMLPATVPHGRVAVAATRLPQNVRRFAWLPALASLTPTGDFTLELPPGRYQLQLIDLATGIVFHTENSEHSTEDLAPMLRPEVHWLDINCKAQDRKSVVVAGHYDVELERPRGGTCRAMLSAQMSRQNATRGIVRIRRGLASQRWLLPRGPIRISVHRRFDALVPLRRAGSQRAIATKSCEIAGAEHSILFEIPAAPSDQELLRQSK